MLILRGQNGRFMQRPFRLAVGPHGEKNQALERNFYD
jgi:hypothetical protein